MHQPVQFAYHHHELQVCLHLAFYLLPLSYKIFIHHIRNLQADSLLYFLKALILASVRPKDKDKEALPYDEKVRVSRW